MIAIVDYGAGNIKSLQFALDKLNLDNCLTTDGEILRQSNAIILPGVGAFKDAMETLGTLGLTNVLKEEAVNGKPLLGICLGMQLFYEKSFEGGEWEGLGLLQGQILRINNSVKVPHMGWNTLACLINSPILKDFPDQDYVYFVHSYAVQNYDQNSLAASTSHGGIIPAIVQQNNIIGMQFHPEKSGKSGLQLLQNFGELIS